MLASSGTIASNDDRAELPLEHQGVAVGALRVGYRRGEDGLSPAEERLLSTLAHQVGASVRARAIGRRPEGGARTTGRGTRGRTPPHPAGPPRRPRAPAHRGDHASRRGAQPPRRRQPDRHRRSVARRPPRAAPGGWRRPPIGVLTRRPVHRLAWAPERHRRASSPPHPGDRGPAPRSISSRSRPCRPPPRRRSTGSSPRPSPTWSDTPERPDAAWLCGPRTDMSWVASPTTASASRPTHSRASARAPSEIEPRNWAAR